MSIGKIATITSYGIIPVIQKEDGAKQYLLLQNNGGFWGFPKGHPEQDETPQQTAIREAREESGLRVSLDALTFSVAYSYQQPIGEAMQTKQVVLFPVLVPVGEITIQPSEIRDYRWAAYQDAVALINVPDAIQALRQVEQHTFFL